MQWQWIQWPNDTRWQQCDKHTQKHSVQKNKFNYKNVYASQNGMECESRQKKILLPQLNVIQAFFYTLQALPGQKENCLILNAWVRLSKTAHVKLACKSQQIPRKWRLQACQSDKLPLEMYRGSKITEQNVTECANGNWDFKGAKDSNGNQS